MTFAGEAFFAADIGFSANFEGEEECPLLTLVVAVDEATPANDKGFSTSFEGEERPGLVTEAVVIPATSFAGEAVLFACSDKNTLDLPGDVRD